MPLLPGIVFGISSRASVTPPFAGRYGWSRGSNGVLAVETDRTITHVNRAACQMLTARDAVVQISGRIACRSHDQTMALTQARRAISESASGERLGPISPSLLPSAAECRSRSMWSRFPRLITWKTQMLPLRSCLSPRKAPRHYLLPLSLSASG